MKLLGLSLETNYFEDYLSFLTEVLELDLDYLDDESMVLKLQGNLVEIRKASVAPQHKNVLLRFLLDQEEYESLVNKISFFYYRKGQSSFRVENLDGERCQLIDPDGRAWSFSHRPTSGFKNTVANL